MSQFLIAALGSVVGAIATLIVQRADRAMQEWRERRERRKMPVTLHFVAGGCKCGRCDE